MALFRKLVISAATAATMIVAAAPAEAQRWGGRGYGWGGPGWNGGYGGGWRGRGWGYRRGGDVGGALVGGLIIGGIVGAIAASDRDRDRADTRPLPPSAEDRVADACAFAVERERQANVRSVTRVDWLDESWIVEGVVDGSSAADSDGRPDSFSCSYRFGEVDSIRYGSEYRPRG